MKEFNDAISRKAAISLMTRVKHNTMRPDAAIDELERLPAAEPEKVQGEWVKTLYGEEFYKCSVCDEEVHIDYGPLPNYCPDCGAQMKGD